MKMRITFGCVLIAVGLWGGSYMTVAHAHDWMGFPSLMTAGAFVMGGLWLIIEPSIPQ